MVVRSRERSAEPFPRGRPIAALARVERELHFREHLLTLDLQERFVSPSCSTRIARRAPDGLRFRVEQAKLPIDGGRPLAISRYARATCSAVACGHWSVATAFGSSRRLSTYVRDRKRARECCGRPGADREAAARESRATIRFRSASGARDASRSGISWSYSASARAKRPAARLSTAAQSRARSLWGARPGLRVDHRERRAHRRRGGVGVASHVQGAPAPSRGGHPSPSELSARGACRARAGIRSAIPIVSYVGVQEPQLAEDHRAEAGAIADELEGDQVVHVGSLGGPEVSGLEVLLVEERAEQRLRDSLLFQLGPGRLQGGERGGRPFAWASPRAS